MLEKMKEEVRALLSKEREEKRQQREREEEKQREETAVVEVLKHQKDQIEMLAQGIRVAQEERLQQENKMMADVLAQMEAKRVLDEKYHK
mmetsp:Transcript_3168/g.3902  ORF Transcript_3168/g.3902 Transcript_3168/m.3902 type:complete len:90 (+) Transcript_3168:455-724(+)